MLYLTIVIGEWRFKNWNR